jgi:hypothetical protein
MVAADGLHAAFGANRRGTTRSSTPRPPRYAPPPHDPAHGRITGRGSQGGDRFGLGRKGLTGKQDSPDLPLFGTRPPP